MGCDLLNAVREPLFCARGSARSHEETERAKSSLKDMRSLLLINSLKDHQEKENS